MLKIRMQRTGRINQPSFRIIVTEHARAAKTGNFVEKVGTYNPKTKLRSLDADRIKYWLSVGAQASGTVHNMLITAGITQGKKKNVLPRKSPPAAKAPEGQAVPAEKAQKGDETKAVEVPATAETPKEEMKPEAAPAPVEAKAE